MFQRMPLIEATRAAAVPAAVLARRDQLRRRRRQALRRSLATGTVWAIALTVAAWLMLAGIAGFAHA
jgi:hypothetical protein